MEKVDSKVRKLRRRGCLGRLIGSSAPNLHDSLNLYLLTDMELGVGPDYHSLDRSCLTLEELHYYSFVSATARKQTDRHPEPFIVKKEWLELFPVRPDFPLSC